MNEFILFCYNNTLYSIFYHISQIYFDYLEKDYKHFLEQNYYVHNESCFGNFKKI